ncbi:MAG: DUF72 domain-containing protein [Thaumarchaeota archaeon]|jgi:uncharacterized protein YecE (DUF72 family)|nr:DUF72 domain-containing protein [Candidatus Geocrenenecus arthurdayi]MCL7391097.1 DUF72 domain-containing protein [Candidatus Geocrenenecus arthurdayi]
MSRTEIVVGCGGWHYFKVLNEDPLKMYSLAFKFVEVNSTFYTLPSLETIVSWRKRVPLDFEFTVKANRIITHSEALRLTNNTLKALKEMLEVCRILNSRVLVLETPKNLSLQYILQNLKSILGEVEFNEVRMALEPRCGWYSDGRESLDEFQSMGIIPITDYSREEPPYDDEEISYSRLFGLGEHNIYQFTDEDLKLIKERADRRKSRKVYLSFHGISMYLDAARMERFIKKGELPPVTSSYGIDSLAEVLSDAVFPTTKNELVKKHGWKLIDVDSKTRAPASVILKQLRKESYRSLSDVLAELRRRFEK